MWRLRWWADRLDRGRVRHVIAGSAHTEKFAGLEGDYTRICVGAEQTGWRSFDESRQQPIAFAPDGSTNATDPTRTTMRTLVARFTTQLPRSECMALSDSSRSRVVCRPVPLDSVCVLA